MVSVTEKSLESNDGQPSVVQYKDGIVSTYANRGDEVSLGFKSDSLRLPTSMAGRTVVVRTRSNNEYVFNSNLVLNRKTGGLYEMPPGDVEMQPAVVGLPLSVPRVGTTTEVVEILTREQFLYEPGVDGIAYSDTVSELADPKYNLEREFKRLYPQSQTLGGGAVRGAAS